MLARYMKVWINILSRCIIAVPGVYPSWSSENRLLEGGIFEWELTRKFWGCRPEAVHIKIEPLESLGMPHLLWAR